MSEPIDIYCPICDKWVCHTYDNFFKHLLHFHGKEDAKTLILISLEALSTIWESED